MNKKTKKRGGSGFRIVIIFLLIIVGASALLTGGIFPKLTNSVAPNQGQANIPETNVTPGSNTSLQIKTFGFKTPSPTPQSCAQTLAVDFLVDKSGSMSNGSKMTELKKGLILFTGSLTDNAIIGMQSFSDTPSEVIPFSYYKAVETQVTNAINSMRPNGWTYTRDAFVFTKKKLEAGVPKYSGYKFALIFVSDGVPETGDCPRTSQPGCKTDQDPTTAPSIAAQIKSMGVRVFSIAYLDSGDSRWNNQLETLMKNAASSPSDYYVAPSSNQITTILNQIAVKLCQ